MNNLVKASLLRIQHIEAKLELEGKLVHPMFWEVNDNYERLKWLFENNDINWVTRIVDMSALERKRKYEFRR